MLLFALLAIVAVVWLLVARPWSGAATEAAPVASQTQDAAIDLPVPSTSTTPNAETTATDAATEPTPDATPVAGDDGGAASGAPTAETCAARDVKVEAATDKDTYGSDQNPQLSIRLTNTSEKDCSLNVGTSSQVFTIMSGDDTWWRSTDCQSEPSDMIVLLAAGQTVSSATPISWDRTRSDVSTCGGAERPVAPGGGASYHLNVAIGGIPAAQSAQFLLY